MRLMSVLAVITLVSILSVHANIYKKPDRHYNGPEMLLDVMRQRYFSIEDAIWRAISGGTEIYQVLQQIHSGHRTFLSDNFSERNCYFSTFDPEQKVLDETIKKINQSVTITIDNYLHSSALRYRETDSLAISARNFNLTNQLDKLFEITGTTDFYMTIRNVGYFNRFSFSLFCCVKFFRFIFIIHTHIHQQKS